MGLQEGKSPKGRHRSKNRSSIFLLTHREEQKMYRLNLYKIQNLGRFFRINLELGLQLCHSHKNSNSNQRKTIVHSWVRCFENNQLVITSGFPTVNFRK